MRSAWIVVKVPIIALSVATALTAAIMAMASRSAPPAGAAAAHGAIPVVFDLTETDGVEYLNDNPPRTKGSASPSVT